MADGEICQHTVTDVKGQKYTCGQVHDPRKCTSHKTIRADDGKAWDGTTRPILGIAPCGMWALKGQRVCKMHGGRAPQTKAKAAERVEMEKAEKMLAKAVVTFGLPREIDPRDALLEEVYRTAGAVDWLHLQVQALQADDVVWGKAEQVDKQASEFAGVDTTYKAAVHVWVELWQRERKHLVDVSKAAIAAGIEERKVRLAEQQGALLADVIQAILGDLDLSPAQQAKVAKVVPMHLRSIAGGQAV